MTTYESLYCPCGEPIAVEQTDSGRYEFFDTFGAKIENCHFCKLKLDRKTLLELGELE